MKTVFSGIKPTGNLGLGNYLGAFKAWGNLQNEYTCIYSVVDLHALTIRNDPQTLKENSRKIIMLYMAAGIDPQKSIIYLQSHVPAHSQLSWILGCHSYMGELSRMTQYKEKSENNENVNAGLFTYPVLMAADILLYNTHVVPVGEDQIQHVELARDIALRFNNIYGNILVVPEAKTASKLTARLKGLQNPTKKMDKSTKDPLDTIFLLDTEAEITKKIKRAVTDSEARVYYDTENKPGISNLLAIYAAITNKTIEDSELDFQNKSYGDFKQSLIEVVLGELNPLQKEFNRLSQDTAYVDNIIIKNAQRAEEIAEKTLAKVQNALGIGK
ncbi:MAG: tryptophan--tRNA ligase [Defluviitaleaceae bacterium]|nr:tryptophan--tRNA ligase [Defluviitaleaceae bacterium]